MNSTPRDTTQANGSQKIPVADSNPSQGPRFAALDESLSAPDSREPTASQTIRAAIDARLTGMTNIGHTKNPATGSDTTMKDAHSTNDTVTGSSNGSKNLRPVHPPPSKKRSWADIGAHEKAYETEKWVSQERATLTPKSRKQSFENSLVKQLEEEKARQRREREERERV